MKLYLVQHGEACAKDVDPDRPLTDAGKADVERLAAFLGQVGIRVDRVIHSGKLRAVQTAERLAGVLANIKVNAMQFPVINNVEAAPNQDAARVVDLLVRQVSAPVRWEESTEQMVNLGVERFIEIGPGKVLAGLVKRMARSATVENVQDADDINTGVLPRRRHPGDMIVHGLQQGGHQVLELIRRHLMEILLYLGPGVLLRFLQGTA